LEDRQMPKSVTTDQAILDDLVRFIIKLDELAVRAKPIEQKKAAAKRADELRKVHLHLFAAEFNATAVGLKTATDKVRQVSAQVANTINDLTQIAATLKLVAKLIDAGTALVAKAAKVALI